VDDEDLAAGLDEIADLGARNVLITLEGGCYALLREDRAELRVRAVSPRMEPVSGVGAGDTLLAGFLAARVNGKPFEEAVRSAVAAGAASVLEAGAGRFDPREASRLASLVQLEHIEHVAQEG
jgi:fructose-1-phosphate kinase PfkB-like protein